MPKGTAKPEVEVEERIEPDPDHEKLDAELDQALEQTFPASDPPSTGGSD